MGGKDMDCDRGTCYALVSTMQANKIAALAQHGKVDLMRLEVVRRHDDCNVRMALEARLCLMRRRMVYATHMHAAMAPAVSGRCHTVIQ